MKKYKPYFKESDIKISKNTQEVIGKHIKDKKYVDKSNTLKVSFDNILSLLNRLNDELKSCEDKEERLKIKKAIDELNGGGGNKRYMERYKPFFEDNKIIKNKQDIVDFVKDQLNIELVNDPNDRLNQKRNILYTYIPEPSRNTYKVLSLLKQKGLRVEEHLDDYYWIWVK
jgi:hypothetical protein